MQIVNEAVRQVIVGYEYGWPQGANWVTFAMCVIVVVPFIIWAIRTLRAREYFLASCCLLIVLICCLFFLCICAHPVTVDVPEYEVVFTDDDYSIKDFMSQYEIMEQRGDIYVVREANWEDIYLNGNLE